MNAEDFDHSVRVHWLSLFLLFKNALRYCSRVNDSFKQQATKCSSAKNKLYHIEFKDWRANSVDLDEVAHHEPPHQDLHCLHNDEPPHLDLHCLHIQLFSSLVLRVYLVLIDMAYNCFNKFLSQLEKLDM